jgi:hypothetical protein
MSAEDQGSLAGIEYVGLPGISKECQDAVLRLLQYGDPITQVKILSSSVHSGSMDHCLLLALHVGDLVAVKSGFRSGYLGEGSRTFSYVLRVLEAHGAEIDEYNVSPDLIERIDSASLTQADIDALDAARPVRPRRWRDYVSENDWDAKKNGRLWREFPPVMPFAIIESRIVDLAISFWKMPDERLLTGYRRLEDIVRDRTGLDEFGAKLFQRAFVGDAAKASKRAEGSSLSRRTKPIVTVEPIARQATIERVRWWNFSCSITCTFWRKKPLSERSVSGWSSGFALTGPLTATHARRSECTKRTRLPPDLRSRQAYSYQHGSKRRYIRPPVTAAYRCGWNSDTPNCHSRKLHSSASLSCSCFSVPPMPPWPP